MHDVDEQWNRLDVTSVPAHILTGGTGIRRYLIPRRNRRCGNLESIAEHGRPDAFRIGVMPFVVCASRNVEINAEVAIAIFFINTKFFLLLLSSLWLPKKTPTIFIRILPSHGWSNSLVFYWIWDSGWPRKRNHCWAISKNHIEWSSGTKIVKYKVQGIIEC